MRIKLTGEGAAMPESARRAARILLPIIAVAMIAAAVLLIWPELNAEMNFERARGAVTGEGAPDMGAAMDLNPDTVAWLSVEGTPIDHPIVQPPANRHRDWYLRHAYDGTASAMGTPYLDARATPGGTIELVYAHNDRTGGLFHSIANADRQKGLDRIGRAIWTTKEGATEFRPLFSIKVDKTYAPIQGFGLDGDDVPSLIDELSEDAVATVSGWEEEASRAGRLLALSTCANGTFGGRQRVICIFSAPGRHEAESGAEEGEPSVTDSGIGGSAGRLGC